MAIIAVINNMPRAFFDNIVRVLLSVPEINYSPVNETLMAT
jgi:hypothetical protein